MISRIKMNRNTLDTYSWLQDLIPITNLKRFAKSMTRMRHNFRPPEELLTSRVTRSCTSLNKIKSALWSTNSSNHESPSASKLKKRQSRQKLMG